MESEILRKEGEVAVTWSGSQYSNALKVVGRSAALLLDLPAAFTGTTLTYERKLADGSWSPLYRGGSLATDAAPGSTKCSIKLDIETLFGVGVFRIKSTQPETAEGTLHVGA